MDLPMSKLLIATRRLVLLVIFGLFFISVNCCAEEFAFGKHGKFEATIDAPNCVVNVVVRVSFDFKKGPHRNEKWPNEAAKNRWKADYIRDTAAHWSGKYRFKRKGNSEVDCDYLRVNLTIVEDDAHPHFRLTVKFTNKHKQSRVKKGGRRVDLDSKDLEQRTRRANGRNNSQTGAFHEFGHMLGLPDKTNDNRSDSIMHSGDNIYPDHYAPIENAVETLSGGEYDTVGLSNPGGQ